METPHVVSFDDLFNEEGWLEVDTVVAPAGCESDCFDPQRGAEAHSLHGITSGLPVAHLVDCVRWMSSLGESPRRCF